MSTGSRSVFFNAPAMRRVDTTKYVGREEPGPSSSPRNSAQYELREVGRGDVIWRKGWMTPDLTYETAWEGVSDEDAEDDDSSDLPPGRAPGSPVTPRQKKVDAEALFPGSQQYGFRFMYNPPQINFSLATTQGVNINYIMSGLEKATALIPSGSRIGVNLTISRVDDLSVLQNTTNLNEVLNFYGADDAAPVGWGANTRPVVTGVPPNSGETAKPYSYKIDQEVRAVLSQIREIKQKGTLHDLEYFFRSVAARNWSTAYRGETADVGMMFKVPMILDLGNSAMRYRVMIDSAQYTHKLFTPSMIPTLTELSLSFQRIPDTINWDGNPAQVAPRQ